MIFKVLLLLILIITFISAKTDEKIVSTLANISKDLEEIAKIATKTKENEPYQPFIISVLKGKDLERLGVSNLKEALELIPGVDTATDNIDNKTAIFRGSNPFAYGQSKLIIDGIVVNNLMFDSYSEFLYMPIEIIKRIEVTRGPGSRVDGVNAYAGSIRVVTYAEQFKFLKNSDKIFFKRGSSKFKGGGFLKNLKEKELDIFIDFYYLQDDKFLPSGKDILSTGVYGEYNKQFSQNKDAPLWTKNYSLGIALKYKDITLKARTLSYKHGSSYGINYMLPQDKDYIKFLNDFIEVDAEKKFNDIKVLSKFGVKFDQFYSNARLAPPGIIFPNPLDNNNLVQYENGFFGFHNTKQRTLYHSLFFDYLKFKKHKIKFGYLLSREETYKVVTKTTDRFGISPNLIDYSDTFAFFDKNAKRDTFIFSIQDNYEINENTTLSYGVNLESNTHIDLEVNPRIALVFIKDENIYKFIYSRSIRNPSWQEMYTLNNSARVGNTNLKPEIVNAFEIAYIKKFSIDEYFQLNAFFLSNKNQINKLNENNRYENAHNSDIYGFEFELKKILTKNSKFYGNYSYVDGKKSDATYLENVAKHMVKSYLIYNINPFFDINLIYKYVGSKKRLIFDTREDLKSYSIFDIGFNFENKKYNYSINLTFKNIFDYNIKYPSEPNTYIDDFMQDKRGFIISFRKEF